MLRGKELNLVYKIMSLMCTVHYPAACFKILWILTDIHTASIPFALGMVKLIYFLVRARVAQLVRAWDS